MKVDHVCKEEDLMHACKGCVEVRHTYDRLVERKANMCEKVEGETHICKKVVVGICKCNEE